tara:strand:+ start:1329 stop:2471 length:1143 start_codon:yes stop_codon:yes gene_type:complete
MSEKQKDQSLDLVAEDITVDQLQDEQVVENVEVSDEETDNVDTDADSVEESMEAEKEVDGEKAAAEVADTVKKSAPKQANAPKTKAGLINASYKAMSQMTKEELTSLYDTMMNVQEDAEEMTEEVVAEDEFVTDTVEIKVDFQEDLNALVSEDEALSEEFKDKAAVIFEAAVTSKLSAEINRLEEQYTTELSEEVDQIKTDLVEKVDGYLSYVVENWMEENKVAVETGLRAEIAESFITGLKGLFEQHYVEVPETKYNLVDDLASKVAELEESLNESTEDNIKLSEQVSNLRRDQIIAEATSGMVEIDAAKLMSLVEGVDFESAATFSKKVSIVKESYFKTAKSVMIDESTDIATDERGVIVESSPTMSRYVSALSKTTK